MHGCALSVRLRQLPGSCCCCYCCCWLLMHWGPGAPWARGTCGRGGTGAPGPRVPRAGPAAPTARPQRRPARSHCAAPASATCAAHAASLSSSWSRLVLRPASRPRLPLLRLGAWTARQPLLHPQHFHRRGSRRHCRRRQWGREHQHRQRTHPEHSRSPWAQGMSAVAAAGAAASD